MTRRAPRRPDRPGDPAPAHDEVERLRERIASLEAELARERAATAVAERAKTQFFAAAIHDLRQPLHALMLFTETLRQQIREPTLQPLLCNIAASVQALDDLFNEVLDLTRIDHGGIRLRARPFRLDEVFARLRLHVEPVAFDKGLTLRWRGGMQAVHADPALVERILRNLVANAIRYTEDGGVLVGCKRRGDRVWLQVWDSGIGIREAALPRIFNEFYQVHGTRRLEPQHRQGLGLGLAIVKRLAEHMGAPLTVRSQVGRGTMFSLELPRAHPDDVRPAPPSRPDALRVDLAGRAVVVVEDDPAVQRALSMLLRRWGAAVQAFDRADTVCAWAGAEGQPMPDLLIVDHGLPEARTGTEVVEALRMRWGAALPVLMVTGHRLHDHAADSARLGFQLLLKPVAPNRLRAMLTHLLGESTGPDAPESPHTINPLKTGT